MATSTYTWTSWNSSSTCTSTTCSTNDAWVAWNSSTDATVTGNSNGEVWYYWTNDQTTPYSKIDIEYQSNDDTWTTWNSGTFRIVEGDFSTPYVDKRRMRLRAKRARLRTERQARKSRARQAMRELELRKAEEKAQELLLDLIGPKQMEIYKQTGRVFVKGRRFDWLLQTEGNRCKLKKIKKGKVLDLCIHIDNDQIPKTDQVIGYLLNAKFNEEHLDKTGNLVRTYDAKEIKDRIRDAANA